jgi:hypothetical protein
VTSCKEGRLAEETLVADHGQLVRWVRSMLRFFLGLLSWFQVNNNDTDVVIAPFHQR